MPFKKKKLVGNLSLFC